MANKEIVIKLDTRELLYDVQNKTHIVMKSREAQGTDGVSAASLQADGAGADGYQLRRGLSDAYLMMLRAISEWLDPGLMETTTDGVDKAVATGGTLSVVLELPMNYDDAATRGIAAGMHSYLVETTLYEWFKLVSPTDSEAHAPAAAAGLSAVLLGLARRVRPVRPQIRE